MDKGIRAAARILFVELNEKRRRGEFGITKKADTLFRRAVCDKLCEDFGITMPSAGGAYQEAFRFVRNLNSELVDGLGRPPEKNNGGRKKKSTQVAQAVTLLLGYTPAATFEPVEFIDEQYEAALMAVAGSIPEAPVVEGVPNGSDELVAVEKTYTVTRAKDGVVVATGITLGDAEQLVAKAKAAKKATLVFA